MTLMAQRLRYHLATPASPEMYAAVAEIARANHRSMAAQLRVWIDAALKDAPENERSRPTT